MACLVLVRFQSALSSCEFFTAGETRGRLFVTLLLLFGRRLLLVLNGSQIDYSSHVRPIARPLTQPSAIPSIHAPLETSTTSSVIASGTSSRSIGSSRIVLSGQHLIDWNLCELPILGSRFTVVRMHPLNVNQQALFVLELSIASQTLVYGV